MPRCSYSGESTEHLYEPKGKKRTRKNGIHQWFVTAVRKVSELSTGVSLWNPESDRVLRCWWGSNGFTSTSRPWMRGPVGCDALWCLPVAKSSPRVRELLPSCTAGWLACLLVSRKGSSDHPVAFPRWSHPRPSGMPPGLNGRVGRGAKTILL